MEAILAGVATSATTLLGLVVAVIFLLNRIDKLGARISEVEREQARLEGANGTLAEVLKQQSHTHEPPADDASG